MQRARYSRFAGSTRSVPRPACARKNSGDNAVTLEEIQRAVEALGSYYFEDLSLEDQEALVDWIEQR
jgi:hypothetical protein